MYFDAVLDDQLQPIFNGTPAEVRAWLKKNEGDPNIYRVCPGKSMRLLTVKQYLG